MVSRLLSRLLTRQLSCQLSRQPIRQPCHLFATGLLIALALLLSACGGGSSDAAPDSLLLPDAQQLEGATCDSCRPGRLQGPVLAGAPLADALLRIRDAQGREVQGRTDALGGYDLAVSGLSGPLLLQATGTLGGAPVQLHSLCRAAEVGTRAVLVSPLTELMAAQVLGGRPADLLAAERVDFQRIGADALRQAEQQAEALVRGLLDAAGAPAAVDLRLSPVQMDHQGLDAVLDLLQLQPAEDGYLLRHAGQPPGDALLLRPGQLAAHAPLPAPGAQALAAVRQLPALAQHLDGWTALFADTLPDAARLRSRLAPGFHDGGLDAEAYIARVLLRDDPPAQGGHSLRGARFGSPRLLQLADDGRLLLQFGWHAVGAAQPEEQQMWLQPQPGGGWHWLGDGRPARAAVHNLAVLGPRPMPTAELLAQAAVVCPASVVLLPSTTISQRCHVAGGRQGLPEAGVLDLQQPGAALFGVLGEFRLADAEPAQRLLAYRMHSRLLAAPSGQVDRYIQLALDARRVDPRAMQARVTGPGLPTTGLLLQPPPRQAGRPVSDAWSLVGDAQGDAGWHGVRLGWCEAAADAAEAEACAKAWQGLRAGARYRFALLDSQGLEIGSVEAPLPGTPATADALWARRAQLFARFMLADRADAQPSLAWLLAADAQLAEDMLAVQWPWQAPLDPGQRLASLDLAWWRSPVAADADGGPEVLRWRQTLGTTGAPAGGVLQAGWPARPGWRGHWLVAQISAVDLVGNRYLHMLSPANPH